MIYTVGIITYEYWDVTLKSKRNSPFQEFSKNIIFLNFTL